MKKNYETRGKRALTSFLSQNPDRQFTVEEICRAVNGEGESGKSSIYRQLSRLCAEETVRKFRSDELGCSVYQYVGAGCDCKCHFHQKCLSCGAIRHLSCQDSASFAHHLFTEHGFLVDCGQSILYGVCAACREKEGGAARA